MQSLKTKFNGNSGEVVNYAKKFGILAAMEQYQIKDYMAMSNFLKEVEPDVVFQATQVNVGTFSNPDAFEKLLEAILRKFAKYETQNIALSHENAELKKTIDYYKGKKWEQTEPLINSVLNYCK